MKLIRSLSLDSRAGRFGSTSLAERAFASALRKIARAAASIVEAHTQGAEIRNTPQMMKALEDYSEALGPWATFKASEMVGQVARSNRLAWETKARQIGIQMRRDLLESPTGLIASQLVREQVALIQSIPLRAAERAQSLALQAAVGGKRAAEIAAELANTTSVSESNAMTIARTEVARSNSAINQARAQSVGSTHYIWRTMEDGDVREAHRKMDGMVCEWARPPTLSDGTTTHPGQIYNCRCYAEPILDDTV